MTSTTVRAMDFLGPCFGLIVSPAGQNHLCAVLLDGFEFDGVHPLRNADRGGYLEVASNIGHGPSMVSARTRDHALPAFIVGEGEHS